MELPVYNLCKYCAMRLDITARFSAVFW